jgi:hypothetical protein
VVLAPVTLSGVLLVAFTPGFWWVFTTYFWVAFPAFGLLARGISSFSERREGAAVAHSTGEQELLEALRREGEISSTWAAMETSRSVTQADAMLRELAQAGHLEVRVRGGGLLLRLLGRPLAYRHTSTPGGDPGEQHEDELGGSRHGPDSEGRYTARMGEPFVVFIFRMWLPHHEDASGRQSLGRASGNP